MPRAGQHDSAEEVAKQIREHEEFIKKKKKAMSERAGMYGLDETGEWVQVDTYGNPIPVWFQSKRSLTKKQTAHLKKLYAEGHVVLPSRRKCHQLCVELGLSPPVFGGSIYSWFQNYRSADNVGKATKKKSIELRDE